MVGIPGVEAMGQLVAQLTEAAKAAAGGSLPIAPPVTYNGGGGKGGGKGGKGGGEGVKGGGKGGKSSGVCFDFQKGRCTRGTSCRFAHEMEGAGAMD